jgi:hypothetical protein
MSSWLATHQLARRTDRQSRWSGCTSPAIGAHSQSSFGGVPDISPVAAEANQKHGVAASVWRQNPAARRRFMRGPSVEAEARSVLLSGSEEIRPAREQVR